MVSIGFVGAGQMARALAHGMVAAELTREIWAADVVPEACQAFQQQVPSAKLVQRNVDLLAHAEVIFLAVKPQHLSQVAQELGQATRGQNSPVWVSIAAGTPLAKLTSWLQSNRVVRVMPNTPCLVATGASAYCLADAVSPTDEQQVVQLLQAVGTVSRVPESLMDAVTGLSGSGPAYMFLILEALADAGVLQGLPRAVALQLAAQTMLGSAQMVLQSQVESSSPIHPAELRDRVTSPGGTTAHGLQVLEERGVRGALLVAVQAATRRSRELGQA